MPSKAAIGSIPTGMRACCSVINPTNERSQSFRITCERRSSARGPADDAPWRGADARLYAGRDRRRNEGDALARGARCRCRHRARQHLPSDAAAGRRTHRRTWGLAEVYGLERADAYRFRRLPGHVAIGVAQGEREGRDLPLAYRRRHGRALARAVDRGAAAARLGHRDADG